VGEKGNMKEGRDARKRENEREKKNRRGK